jgi:hypothetical protein
MSIESPECASPQVTWFKSSYSTGSGGECVEVATAGDSVHLRDSKDPFGPCLTVDPAAWSSFICLATTHNS